MSDKSSTIRSTPMWKEISESPEVKCAFSMAKREFRGDDEALEMALVALYVQNQRLREGLINIAKEFNRTDQIVGGMDENHKLINGNT